MLRFASSSRAGSLARASAAASSASPALAWSSFRGFASSGERQEVVIIGGGPGGYVAAIKAAQLGKKVTCVETRGSLGGTCLNVGCIPSKSLLNSSHKFHDAKHSFEKHGIGFDNLTLNWPQMLKLKDQSVTGLTRGIEGLFKMNGVGYSKGFGRVTGANQVTVDLNDGGQEVIETDNIVIATGSDSTKLPFLEVDEERIVTSTGALSLREVPQKLVVVGAGIIGLELGSVYARLGSEVTVVEFLDRICPGMDSEIAKNLQRSLKKQGLDFKLKTKVMGADKSDSGVSLKLESAKGGKASTLDADVVLVSIGRSPYTAGLGLDAVGVEMDAKAKGCVKVNEKFQTNVPSIFAIGDVIRGPMLAHKAEEEGIAVAEILAGQHGHVNYDVIPGVVYTHPEVAWVGQTEEELQEAGVDYGKGVFPFMANSRAKTNVDTEGLVKVLTEKATDKILGVHIMNSQAGELIGEAALALEYGAASEDVSRTCHAHPTLSEAVKEACMAAHGKAIHS